MSARPYLFASTLSLAFLTPMLAMSPALVAQVAPGTGSEPAADVNNARFMSTGIVNTNSVMVRSGAGASYYATSKLNKGDKVTVVGMRFDWLKIVPPEGSFCYIAKLYVDRRGDGSIGRVNKDAVSVHAGSSLNEMKVVSLCQLAQGTDVQILGDHEEYFKIKPPAKAYLYIGKQFVDPDPSAKPVPQKLDVAVVTAHPPTSIGPVAPDDSKPAAAGATAMPQPSDIPPIGETAATTNPSTMPSEAAAAPATQPADAAADAEALYSKTEADFIAASAKPLDEQPIAELKQAFESVAANEALAPSLRRIAEARLATLKVRGDSATQLAEVRKSQEDLKKKELVLSAEREELEQRIAASGVVRYAAVGTLQTSSLQQGTQTLYRLTDPASGRTVVYLRTNDGKLASLLGQFIGVKGNVVVDPQLNLHVITPTEFATVDPAKLSGSVSADLVPPSLMPKTEASSN